MTLDTLTGYISKMVECVVDTYDKLSDGFGIIILIPVVVSLSFSVIGMLKSVLMAQKSKGE